MGPFFDNTNAQGARFQGVASPPPGKFVNFNFCKCRFLGFQVTLAGIFQNLETKYLFIAKNLTAFHKTLEAGLDSRLKFSSGTSSRYESGSWYFLFLFRCFQRVEQQERDDAEMHVKPKGGRSQQQRKKPSKPAKKADDKPKAQAKKPVAHVDTEDKENKKATQKKGGKGKSAPAKKSDKSDDSFEFDEGDAAPPMLSLADRLAQRKKDASSSSSSAGSGAESVSSSSSKVKKQATLEMLSSKKVSEKKAKKTASDDDFIMEFSDEEEVDVPAPKRTARASAVTKKVSSTVYSSFSKVLCFFLPFLLKMVK